MVTRPRLGELLLSRGVCTREQLFAAWEQRVLYGDRLGTNLLAIGALDEATLARALGAQHGVHAGHGDVLHTDPAALARVPKSLVQKHMVVPHHIADRSLFLLMRDPSDAVAVDEVQFASGLNVVPIVVVEARLWRLLFDHYGVRTSLRPITLSASRPAQHPAPVDIGEAQRPPDLSSEEDFQRLYAGMHAVPALLHTTDLDEDSGAVTAAGPAAQHAFLLPPRTGAQEAHAVWREALEHGGPVAGASAHGAAQPLAADLLAADAIDAPDLDAHVVHFPVRQATLDFHIDVQSLVDETPLTFPEATRMLSAAGDRHVIAKLVLRAARSRFQRACLLAAFPDRFVGWLGIGEGMQTERLVNVEIARSGPSVFAFVAQSRAPYVGPLHKWPLHGAWVKQTGRQIPKSLAVFPILVHGRTATSSVHLPRAVNLLVVDNGHGAHVDTDLGEVAILSQQIAATYEQLLV